MGWPSGYSLRALLLTFRDARALSGRVPGQIRKAGHTRFWSPPVPPVPDVTCHYSSRLRRFSLIGNGGAELRLAPPATAGGLTARLSSAVHVKPEGHSMRGVTQPRPKRQGGTG